MEHCYAACGTTEQIADTGFSVTIPSDHNAPIQRFNHSTAERYSGLLFC